MCIRDRRRVHGQDRSGDKLKRRLARHAKLSCCYAVLCRLHSNGVCLRPVCVLYASVLRRALNANSVCLTHCTAQGIERQQCMFNPLCCIAWFADCTTSVCVKS
eukprot:TRINITY_DN67944_c0_g1_i2.p2 TRINITY_DN67944_c0_g1~~TRINITY_DN67944_c0_g1_i2.p2  ORF type:complete len:104 (+),score=11.48 TRINITY_DN67944_c0_g1_i2:1-312(+)